MSWLSKLTGVHISPHGAHLSSPDPLGAIGDAVSNPIFDAGLALAVPGVGSAITGALGSIPGVSSVAGILGMGGTVGGAIPAEAMGESAGGGGIGGILAHAGKWLTGNGGQNALGLAQGVTSVLDQKKSNEYGQQALNAATAPYNAAAPLRAQGMQGLLNPQAPNLSALQGVAGNLKMPDTNPALAGKLSSIASPTAGALSQFTPPQQVAQSAKSLVKDAGNPYAATV